MNYKKAWIAIIYQFQGTHKFHILWRRISVKSVPIWLHHTVCILYNTFNSPFFLHFPYKFELHFCATAWYGSAAKLPEPDPVCRKCENSRKVGFFRLQAFQVAQLKGLFVRFFSVKRNSATTFYCLSSMSQSHEFFLSRFNEIAINQINDGTQHKC